MEMFDSYEEFMPLSLLHDDEEDTHHKSGFVGLSTRISMKCYKKLHEITTENTARCLKMTMLQMLQMLQRFFARKRKSGYFELQEDLAGHATAATIGAHDGQSLLRLRMLCKGYPCQSDYIFGEEYTPLNTKSWGRTKVQILPNEKIKKVPLERSEKIGNAKSLHSQSFNHRQIPLR